MAAANANREVPRRMEEEKREERRGARRSSESRHSRLDLQNVAAEWQMEKK